MKFSYLKNFMDDYTASQSPGCAAVVYKDGKKVFNYAVGYASLEEKTPLTGNEHFFIYSCSKITTVTAALQLLEQGKFLATDLLYEYIPEFKDMVVKEKNGELRPAKTHITIRDLFTMTAGFHYDLNCEAFRNARTATDGRMDTVDVIRRFASEPLSFDPGEYFQYSLCHDVLAALVSVVSGQKFRDYVRDNIFLPLEMNETCYHLNNQTKRNMAQQYCFIANPNRQPGEPAGTFENYGFNNFCVLGEEYDSGGGGIITTVHDYAKLTAALANKGTGLTGNTILSPGSVELLYTNALNEKQMTTFNWQQLIGYGYGYGVRTLVDKSLAGSTGNLSEFGWGGAAGASALMDTKENLAAFFIQHMQMPREEYYQPRLRNVLYSSIQG